MLTSGFVFRLSQFARRQGNCRFPIGSSSADCSQIDEALQLTPLSAGEVSEARKSADAKIWIDLQGFEPSEFEDWLDKLEVKGLSRQLRLEARNRAGFYPLKNEILMIIPPGVTRITPPAVACNFCNEEMPTFPIALALSGECLKVARC
jgi:hypothetical protein